MIKYYDLTEILRGLVLELKLRSVFISPLIYKA